MKLSSADNPFNPYLKLPKDCEGLLSNTKKISSGVLGPFLRPIFLPMIKK